MDNNESRQTREARVEHLAKNWGAYKLEAYPWGRDPWDDARVNKENAIKAEMRDRGLYSKATGLADIRLENLVAEAREAMRDGQPQAQED